MAKFQVKPADLVKVWAVPRSEQVKQFTVRIPLESFQKIQALERMFPGRSRNELIADLLVTALDELEQGLERRWEKFADWQDEGRDEGEWERQDTEGVYQDPETGEWGRWIGPRSEYLDLVEQVKREAEHGPVSVDRGDAA